MNGLPSARLGDVASIDRETINASEIQSGTLYIGLENVMPGGELVAVASVDPGDLASGKFRFTPSHVLFGKLRPYLAKVARPAFDGVCSTDILPIRPGSTIDRDFLAHYLLWPQSVAWAAARSTGANLPRLDPTILMNMSVPVPPLAEQRRIAAALDRIHGLRFRRRTALANLGELTRSIFWQMFGDPVTN